MSTNTHTPLVGVLFESYTHTPDDCLSCFTPDTRMVTLATRHAGPFAVAYTCWPKHTLADTNRVLAGLSHQPAFNAERDTRTRVCATGRVWCTVVNQCVQCDAEDWSDL